jgi:hypothetical protein
MASVEAVSSYLNDGGDPARLGAILYERGWVQPTSKVAWTDVDGDANLDFTTALTSAPGGQVPTSRAVFLWRCRSGSYHRTVIAPPRPGFDPPELREARDLTGDGVAELIVAYPACGAHTCFAQFAVYQWNGAAMVDRFQGTTDDIPAPELSIESVDPAGPATIRVTAGGIGSVGAGPYRIWSRSWAFDDEVQDFVPGEAEIEPPRFRIHAIHDADDALRSGDLTAALALYERAIEDNGLLDWPSPGDRRAQLVAYASFRRVLAFLMGGDSERAQAEHDIRLTGSDPTSIAYAELSRRLIAGFAEGALADACEAASAYVSENTEEMLVPLDFGYANRAYGPSDICPLESP